MVQLTKSAPLTHIPPRRARRVPHGRDAERSLRGFPGPTEIPEDKALKAAAALSKRDEEVVSIKGEFLVLKWMMGFVLAFQIAIFVKLFMH